MHIQIIHESITTGDLYKVKPSAEVQNQKGDKGVLGFVWNSIKKCYVFCITYKERNNDWVKKHNYIY